MGKLTKNLSSNQKKILKILLATFFISISSRYFIIYSNIYVAGFAGISQGLTYTLWDGYSSISASGEKLLWGLSEVEFKNTFYWIWLIVLNIGIVIWTKYYFGKTFLRYSLLTFLFSFSFTMLWSYTPVLNEAGFIPDFDIESADPSLQYSVSTISAIIAGIMGGISAGVIFNQGSSNLGTDPIARYLSRAKGKSIATFIFTFAIINSIFWTTISWAATTPFPTFENFISNVLFSYRILASIIYMLVFTMALTIIHPVSKRFLVRITSEKAKKIIDFLNNDIHYHRGQTIYKAQGGYTHKEKETIEMIINSEEFKDLVQYVKNIDENAFIVSSRVYKLVTGNKDTKWTPLTVDDKKREELHSKRRTDKMRKQLEKMEAKNKKDL